MRTARGRFHEEMSAPSLVPALSPPDSRMHPPRVHGARVIRASAGERWGVAPEPSDRPVFHALVAGEAWVSIPGHGAQHLKTGDVLWVPAERRHHLSSHLDGHAALCDELSARRSAESGSAMRLGFGSTHSRLMTIAYDADRQAGCASLHAFAEPVLLRGQDDPTRLALLSVLDAERSQPQFGSDVAAGLLAEMLLIHLYRDERARACADHRDAITDPRLDDLTSRVHALIHRHPERPWTSDSLSAAVHVSRATLHRHFTTALGTTPMRYLTQWRMQRAGYLLRQTELEIQEIATAVGYASTHAFGRAFRRTYSASPRQYREAAPVPQPRSGRPAAT